MRSFALRNSLIRGGAAVLASSAIVLAVAAPGSAATTPLAYADSNALNLSLLGSPISTGTVVSTTDGKTTTTTGNQAPLIQLLGNQMLIPSTGVLVQNSKASMSGLDGVSQSCAGLAGAGGQVVAVGNGDCIKGGQQLSLDPGSVDLTKVQLSSAGILSGLLGPVQAALQPLLDPILSTVSGSVLTPLSGAIPIHLNLGTVSAWCTATPTSVAGNGSVAGLNLVVGLPAPIGPITVPLSIATGKNVRVVADLHLVVDAIKTGLVNALDSQITGIAGINTLLSTLGVNLGNVINTINTNIIAAVDQQLGNALSPILDGVINAQTQTAAPHPTISVTALDLKVLPILGNQAIELRVGKVDCGPNYASTECVLHPDAAQCQPAFCTTHPTASTCQPKPPATCQQRGNCPPPNTVTSGLAAGYLPTGPLGMAFLGLTVVAAAGAGVTAGARALRKSA